MADRLAGPEEALAVLECLADGDGRLAEREGAQPLQAILERLFAYVAPAHPQEIERHQGERLIAPRPAGSGEAVEVHARGSGQHKLGIDAAAGRQGA